MNEPNFVNPEVVPPAPEKPSVAPMRRPLHGLSLIVPLVLLAVLAGGYYWWNNFGPLPSQSMTNAELTAKIKVGQTLQEVQTFAGKEANNEMAFSAKGGFQPVYRFRTSDGNVFVAFDMNRDSKSARVQSVQATPLNAAQKNGGAR